MVTGARPQPAPGPSRLFFLDWLRVLAMLGIFLFHNARFYDVFTDWQVKNATTSFALSIFPIGFMNECIMPLFFLLAGAGTYYALKSRRAGQFIRDRVLRLLVPLIFGMLFIVAPQAYFEALNHGTQLAGYNLFQIYGMFLLSMPTLPWYHLWFLAYLFAFSVVTVPVFFNPVKGGKSIVSWIAGFLDKPWALLLALVLSLAALDVLLYPAGFWGSRSQGNWSIAAYLLFFVCGYLIFANARIIATIRKLTWVFLGVAVVALASLVTVFFDVLVDREAYFGSPMFVASQFAQAVNTWGWLLAMLGLASRFLNRDSRFLSYANEAVLPFYVLHQTVIIIVGFYVVQWNTGVGLKYLTISTTSFVVIMLVYEFVVRRTNALRFLFGMKPLKKARLAEPAPR